jgi:1-acyl-sn-glycerol-3-phosphate acyltransferase
MRPIYFLLKFILGYSLRVYHKTYIKINKPKKFWTRTIFASNHPSSFLDPLVISVRQFPIIHFMTRADIYQGFIKFVFWNVHMIPIFRAQDGNNAAKKNDEVFDLCFKEMKRGKGLILFAEGFTDDVFIRRLKPIKKGAIRIGFYTCEKLNWKKKIYIQATGLNYTDPKKLRSSVLISYGEHICLNDYRDEYEQNPAKATNELTKKVELDMKAQITHVENIHWVPFHENVMQLTRKGMNNECYDKKIKLIDRWKYSRNLALWLNQQDENNISLVALIDKTKHYFSTLKKEQLTENYVYEYSKKGKLSLAKSYTILLTCLPLLPFGFIHGAPIYFWLKPFVEKTFKRAVFWSGVKMVGGIALAGFYNIAFVFLFHAFVYPSWWLAILYYFTIPLIGFLGMRAWLRAKMELPFKRKAQSKNLKSFMNERAKLLEEIKRLIPVA